MNNNDFLEALSRICNDPEFDNKFNNKNRKRKNAIKAGILCASALVAVIGTVLLFKGVSAKRPKYGGIQQSPPHILEFDGIDDFADFLSLSSASDEIKEQYLETLDKTKSGIANKSIFNVTLDSLSNLSYLLIDTNDISVMNVLYYLDYNYVMISYDVGKSDVVLRSISYLSEAKDDFVFSEDIFYVSGLSFKKVISDNKEYVVFMCIEKTFTISLIASAELETWCIDNLGYCFEVEKGVNLY